jgi:hypothetical protein
VWKMEVGIADRGEDRCKEKERVSKDSERKENKERRKERAPPQWDGTP